MYDAGTGFSANCHAGVCKGNEHTDKQKSRGITCKGKLIREDLITLKSDMELASLSLESA